VALAFIRLRKCVDTVSRITLRSSAFVIELHAVDDAGVTNDTAPSMLKTVFSVPIPVYCGLRLLAALWNASRRSDELYRSPLLCRPSAPSTGTLLAALPQTELL